MTAEKRHFVHVQSGPTPDRWHAVCSCGWSGPDRSSEQSANQDADQHLIEMRQP